MRYHQKFGYTYIKKIQTMARLGTIPKKLKLFLVPTCSSCLYEKVNKGIWMSVKSENTDNSRKTTKLGEYVSFNQLVLPTPVLVAKSSGF